MLVVTLYFPPLHSDRAACHTDKVIYSELHPVIVKIKRRWTKNKKKKLLSSESLAIAKL